MTQSINDLLVGANRRCRHASFQVTQALRRSRDGFSTKIHITVNSLGNPLRLRLTAGQRHNINQAQALLAGNACDFLISDRGYASQAFIDFVGASRATPVHSTSSTQQAAANL